MDQVFVPYTFLESEIIMKLLLTFLTISLFSFGANAFYNEKLSKEAYKKFSMYAVNQSMQLFASVDKGDIKALEYWNKVLVETATIYNAFCKD